MMRQTTTITTIAKCNAIIAARINNNKNRIRKHTQSVFQQELLGYNTNNYSSSISRNMMSVSNNASLVSFYANDRYNIRNTLNNSINYDTKHNLNQTTMTTINRFSIQTPSTDTSDTNIGNENNDSNVHVETTVSTAGSVEDSTKMSVPTTHSLSSSTSTTTTATNTKLNKRKVRPRKAAVQLTERARQFFRSILIENPLPKSNIIGIVLNHHQSTTGEPRMVYSFDFHYSNTDDSTNINDTNTNNVNNNNSFEGVSLEVIPVTDTETGIISYIPKSYDDSYNDNLPKLYIHPHAFLKVLGATVDIEDTTTMTPILYDRSGNIMDPNA